jgi:hypothetical protein
MRIFWMQRESTLALQFAKRRRFSHQKNPQNEPRKPSLLKARLGRNHLLVQNTHNQHVVQFGKVEHNMLAVLKPAQPRMN